MAPVFVTEMPSLLANMQFPFLRVVMTEQNFDLAISEKADSQSTNDAAAAANLSRTSWELVDSKAPKTGLTPQVATEVASPLKLDEPGRDWINFGFLSHHQNRQAHFNERNFGLGWEHKFNEDVSSSVGFYRNSVRRESAYAAVLWEPLHLGPVKAGVMAGVINGYPRLNHGNFIPMALPVASIEGRHLGANLICIPKLKDVSAVCAVQIKARF